ncbi:GatB/YqeY domain-containing protein [Occultella aeris]|uniref:Yqey-like protein n=1 Tax=Occultella aeris TaxID=2761496 RepID=A0A7M4DS10_9MICO|nr:GatB/YqeY domain-containing protein [Occultella aeris]VZO40254.1 Yqey-like protein [Occultella aeris]
MRATMRRDLLVALKARDRVTVAALRSALAAIDNAEAVEVPTGREGEPEYPGDGPTIAGSAVGLGAAETTRRDLSEADIAAIVAREVRERTDAALEYEAAGRTEGSARLREEAQVLSRYLDATG